MARTASFFFHFLSQMRASREFSRLPNEQRRDYSAHRFARIVQYAKRHSRFYARHLADVDGTNPENCPLLDKASLIRNFNDIVTDTLVTSKDLDQYFTAPFSFSRRFRGKFLAFHTSGSTGEPAYVVWGNKEIGISTAGLFHRISRSLHQDRDVRKGALARERVAYIGILDDYVGGNSWAYSMRGLANLLMMSVHDPLDKLCHQLQEFQPGIIMTKPSLLGELARQKADNKLDISLHKVIFAGENISPQDANDIEAYFGVRPCNSYSMCETGPIAYQMDEQHQSLELLQELVYVELVDDDGRPIRSYYTPGYIVVTNCYNTLMPMIRYKTGDQASFIPSNNSNALNTISYVHGRNTSHFIFSQEDGTEIKVSECPFWSLYVPGVLRYQVFQPTINQLLVRVQWKSGFAEKDEAAEKIKQKIRRILASHTSLISVELEIEEVPEIIRSRAGKIQITFPLGKALAQ
jgi:phenylacetate-CoA ligase